MRIELDNVVPGPFRELAELDSEIWGTQAVFDRPGFYQNLGTLGPRQNHIRTHHLRSASRLCGDPEHPREPGGRHCRR